MSQFKKMVEDAAKLIDNDNDIENVVVIISKKDGERTHQHLMTNITFPMGGFILTFQHAMEQIAKEKAHRLGLAANDEEATKVVES